MILEFLYRGACLLCISSIIRITATLLEEDARARVKERAIGQERTWGGRRRYGHAGHSIQLGGPMEVRAGALKRNMLSIQGSYVLSKWRRSGLAFRKERERKQCYVQS
ncbi:hypothetical protein B0J13DRAFT_277168 [Dactylonectria estremocensis]|uniref:Uncharacterized protein n=1 Tax=Dactylonectria estremocensis TaxID=1079267 RepID=A0A9P9F0H2_9HYPO|nr:hypothetical protein B0J13DRAFT_277168 [Dactylonectria estremocensis]